MDGGVSISIPIPVLCSRSKMLRLVHTPYTCSLLCCVSPSFFRPAVGDSAQPVETSITRSIRNQPRRNEILASRRSKPSSLGNLQSARYLQPRLQIPSRSGSRPPSLRSGVVLYIPSISLCLTRRPPSSCKSCLPQLPTVQTTSHVVKP